MKVYITVCYDRHNDDDIQVHRTLKLANECINKFIESYEGRYEWANEIHYGAKQNCYCSSTWLRYEQTINYDGGPTAHIEVTELK